MSIQREKLKNACNQYLVKKSTPVMCIDLKEIINRYYNGKGVFAVDFLDAFSQDSLKQKLSLIFSILSELNYTGVEIFVSEYMLEVLLKLCTETQDPEFMRQSISKRWGSIDPEALPEAIKAYNITLPSNEIIEYAFYLLMIKQHRKLLSFLKGMGFIVIIT